jgi:hypothetical protein
MTDATNVFINRQGEAIDDGKIVTIQGLSSDYLIYLTLDWYFKQYDFELGTDGKVPMFDATRFIFYPAYFIRANGSSKSLLKALYPIKAFSHGLFSEIMIERYFKGGENSKYFKIDGGKISVKQEYLNSNKSTQDIISVIGSSIQKEVIDSGLLFEDVHIKNNNDELVQMIAALRSSRNALEISRGSRFLNYGLLDFKKTRDEYGDVKDAHTVNSL